MSDRKEEFRTGVGSLMKITLAPWIWAFHFVICYGATAVWCARLTEGGDTDTLQIALIAVTVVALACIAACGIVGKRVWTRGGFGEDGEIPGIDDEESRTRFLGHATVLLSIVSAIGVVFVILPVLMIGTCR
ncbi:hypothetical protein [Oceaniglobus roseus]|uniref:hypothetical protein n=1 Tax=Oceaniglobus roseus TaxID=1737570 RepID=UPI000C7EF07C|nr:hypothetical protein [Kandeliimicrobium roseum]